MTKSNKRIIDLILIALVIMYATMVHANDRPDWEEDGTTLVGRVTHLEGALSRYDTDREEWVGTVKDAPVGRNDQLYTDVESKAELILPNNAWIRMDADTDVHLLVLDENYTELDVSLGKVRLSNKSSTAEIKATTPFGHIMTPPGAGVDIDVYSDGVDIVAVDQVVYFVHNRTGDRFEIRAGAGSLFAGNRQVSAGRDEVATAWEQWNRKMDALWAARSQTRGVSTTYLPPALHYDAYTLDTHGRWERVYYQGAYYRFWRPVHVHVGWTPFSSGTWHVWWGDHVWIPHEPFGYVTHHYGNWVFAAGCWYWAPPVTRVSLRTHLPLLPIGFGWYPGRVAWIHAGVQVGWFPLGPYEPFYSHRRWGKRSVVVVRGNRQTYRHHHYKHRRHAVVVHQKDLYRGKNHNNPRIRHFSAAEIDRKFRTSVVPRSRIPKEHRTSPGRRTIRQDLEPRQRRVIHNPNSRPNQRSVKTSTDKPTMTRIPGANQLQKYPKTGHRSGGLRMEKSEMPKKKDHRSGAGSRTSYQPIETTPNPAARSFNIPRLHKRTSRKPSQRHQMSAGKNAIQGDWHGHASGSGASARQGSRRRR